MAKIYTKTGDTGMTSLIGGKRVPKSHLLIEICGSLDELSAFIGVLYDVCNYAEDWKAFLMRIQNNLFHIESFYASEMSHKYDLEMQELTGLEQLIDSLSESSSTFDGFVLPGGNIVTSYAHVCRTICRRCERQAVKADQSSCCIRYLNRLSDFFFILSQYFNNERP